MDVTGPLEQFQNRRFNKSEFRQLFRDINNQLEKSLEPGALEMIFGKWWPDLQKGVEVALADVKDGAPRDPKRSEPDLLEEMLVRVRNIEKTMDNSFLGKDRR